MSSSNSTPPNSSSKPCTPDTPLPFRQALPWVAFITLLFLLNYMGRATLSPLLVHVESDLNIGHAAAGSLLLMQSIGMCLALSASSFLLSRIRPRFMLAVPLMLCGVVLVCMLMVKTLLMAQVLFFLFGLMAGVFFPSSLTTLSTQVYPKDWGKAVGVHELAPNLGFILIPLFAQVGLLFTNWQGVFALMGGLMVATGLAFLICGRGGNTTTAAPSFAECRTLLKNPASWAAALLLCVATIGEFSVYSILQLFLVNDALYSPETANILLSLSRASAPFVVLLGGVVADRFNPGNAVRICFAVQAFALLLMSLDATTMHTAVMIGVFLQAASVAFLFPPIFKLFARAFPLREQPLLLSLSLPLAALSAFGAAPFFLGFCGEYLSFATGFCTLAVLSALTIFSVKAFEKKQ